MTNRALRVAFCITCGNRAEHLKQTLPTNLWRNLNATFVLLDYGSTDGLGHYIWSKHREDIQSGRLVYYRFEAPHFRMAHAKNMAHRLGIREGADILVNLDADNWAGPNFADYVAEKFMRAQDEGDSIFVRARENHTSPGVGVRARMPFGSAGRIAVTKLAFLQAGGYDEVYSGWSPDDKDFATRVHRLGYVRSGISRRFLNLIYHDDDCRFGFYGPDDPATMKDSEAAFRLEGRDAITVVNNGRIGLGTVRRNFYDQPIEIEPVPTRIFGIGMNKTATTSLSKALKILGFDGAHWESPRWARRIYDEMTTQGRSRTLEGYYCIGDMPIDLLFREVDAAYPGSKFILTVRDDALWLRSIERYFAWKSAEWTGDDFTDDVHTLIYGRPDFHAETWLARYRRHNAEVLEYFKDRPQDLLVMDVSKGADWAPLCDFLGVAVPNEPYPFEFITPDLPASDAYPCSEAA